MNKENSILTEECVICGASLQKGETMVFAKNRATTCHAHQNRGKDTKPRELDCGYDCHFKEPYGFVPEAGCLIHDK